MRPWSHSQPCQTVSIAPSPMLVQNCYPFYGISSASRRTAIAIRMRSSFD